MQWQMLGERSTMMKGRG